MNGIAVTADTYLLQHFIPEERTYVQAGFIKISKVFTVTFISASTGSVASITDNVSMYFT